MKTTADVYHPLKVEKIRRKLEQASASGKPEYYSVQVDELEVIPLTNDPSLLLNYHGFVDGLTKEVSVFLYGVNPEGNPINYVFYLQDKSVPTPSLQGTDFEKRLDERMNVEKERWQASQLKKQYEDVCKQLSEAEEYIGILQEKLEESKKAVGNNKFDLGSIAGIIKDNPEILSIFSGKADLPGKLSGNKKDSPEKPSEQSSFKKKGESQVNGSDQYAAESVDNLFSKEEQQVVQRIVMSLAQDKEAIKKVSSILNINSKTKNKEEASNGNV